MGCPRVALEFDGPSHTLWPPSPGVPPSPTPRTRLRNRLLAAVPWRVAVVGIDDWLATARVGATQQLLIDTLRAVGFAVGPAPPPPTQLPQLLLLPPPQVPQQARGACDYPPRRDLRLDGRAKKRPRSPDRGDGGGGSGGGACEGGDAPHESRKAARSGGGGGGDAGGGQPKGRKGRLRRAAAETASRLIASHGAPGHVVAYLMLLPNRECKVQTLADTMIGWAPPREDMASSIPPALGKLSCVRLWAMYFSRLDAIFAVEPSPGGHVVRLARGAAVAAQAVADEGWAPLERVVAGRGAAGVAAGGGKAPVQKEERRDGRPIHADGVVEDADGCIHIE